MDEKRRDAAKFREISESKAAELEIRKRIEDDLQ